MPIDYIVLGVIAVLGIGCGLFLLSQAKKYRARHHIDDKHLPHLNR